MTQRTINQRIDQVSGQKCRVSGCNLDRYRISPYCVSHWSANHNHGHPVHRAIAKQDFAQYVNHMGRIVHVNGNHQGIQHAISTIENLIRLSFDPYSTVPAKQYLNRLNPSDGRQIFISLSACLYFCMTTDWVETDRQVNFALGKTLLRFKPLSATIYGHYLRDTGIWIKDKIGPMLVNMVNSLRDMEKRKLSIDAAYRAPLVMPKGLTGRYPKVDE